MIQKLEKTHWARTRAFRERAVVYMIGAMLFVVASVFRLFERFIEWAGQYEIWYLGELVITAALMVVALEILALRRLREFLRESALRKRAELELEYKDEYFRALVENSSDGIYVLNADGTIRYAGSSVERLLGYPPESQLGKNLVEYVSPDEAVIVGGAFSRLIEDPGSTITIEARFRHLNGSWRTVEAISKNLMDDVVVAGIVVNFRDVTERKEAEEEKQRMEEQVHLAGRLAAVGELAAGVAHELNNPLSAVQAYAEFLASRKGLDESIRKDLETIYGQTQRATRITGNLLSFARRHSPERRLISINEVIEKSTELHAYRLRVNNIELSLELDPTLPRTMADFHQIQQILVNIVTNAEQVMTEARGEGKLCIKTEREGEVIRIIFTDDGPGIPEEDLKRIFDSFFTTKEAGKGTGLGLSICRGIVKNHGGKLYAMSKVGEGTTFVVELPIVSASQSGAEPSESAVIQ
ncbi:MAG: ATP-binding protein [Dehalococcoidia bacterium]